MKRVLLSGYYGFSNAGDEAVLAGLISSFRSISRESELQLAVLSANPAATTREHQTPSFHRYRQVLSRIAASDMVLSGGGSLLQDVTSAHSIFYYLAVVRIAQILGKRTMFIAQGIGPLTRSRSRKLTASVANKLDAITVRDTESADLLRAIGVDASKVTITADPAILLSPSCPVDLDAAPAIAISLRDWPGEPQDIHKTIAQTCQSLPQSPKLHIIPMHHSLDLSSAYRLEAACEPGSAGVYETAGYQSAIDAIAQCQMTVSMRLHALIFAAACEIGSVAISYDPKVESFMMASGQVDGVVALDSKIVQKIPGIIADTWSQRHIRAEMLREVLPQMRKRALQNAQIAISIPNKG